MPPLPRADCSHCRLSTALRVGGLVREHQDPATGRKCAGSGKPPWSSGRALDAWAATVDRSDVAVLDRDEPSIDAPSQPETASRDRDIPERDGFAWGGEDGREISPGLAAQIAQERSGPGHVPETVDELHRTAQAGVFGGPGIQVDGQFVTHVTPLEGLKAVRRLREVVDELEAQLIAKCRERNPVRWGYLRRELHSWSEISEAIGIPKQTLHRRYGPGGPG